MYDTSLEGIQKRKALEKELLDADDEIAETKKDRSRDLIKQNLEDSKDAKKEETEDALDSIDEEFSLENKKLMAHNILLNETFTSIKDKLPELFKELNVNASDFFSVFETYEQKFGSVIENTATKFHNETLPELQKAIKDIKDIETIASSLVNYKGYEFDKKKDYTSTLIDLYAKGYSDTSPEVIEAQKARAAKVYSDPKLISQYEDIIPVEYKQSGATTAINAASSVVATATKTEEISKYTEQDIAQAKDKMKIKKLQIEYANATKKRKEEIADEAKDIRKKWGWKYEDLVKSNYQYPVGMFSAGINAGLVQKTGMYLLHGSETNPEWVLTNQQMYNMIRSMANNLTSGFNPGSSGINDISININIEGNADQNTVNQLKYASNSIMNDLKKELNKIGAYK
jgi:hypothetical protein